MRSLAPALLLVCLIGSAQTQHPSRTPPSYDVAVPGHPFGIVISDDGDWGFVALTNDSGDGGVAILQQSTSGYALARVLPLPHAATGLARTHDGALLIVAAGSEVDFVNIGGVSANGAGAASLAGSISDGANAGSIWASVTADDRWLFVCDETSAQLTVIDLKQARSSGFPQSAILGKILVGSSPTATVFSPDGVWAYTTVQVVSSLLGWPKVCTLEGSNNPALVNPQGAVVFFQVAPAASFPSSAVSSTSQFVPAGCSPVRLALSADGLHLYVTARNSNEAVVLDTSKFTSDPMHAAIATAPVGVAPVPVALIDSGALVVVGNSNRFQAPGTPQFLDVIDAARLHAGAAAGAIVRTIPAGAFPRTLTLTPDGKTLFLSNYDSNSVQVMDAARVAAPPRSF